MVRMSVVPERRWPPMKIGACRPAHGQQRLSISPVVSVSTVCMFDHLSHAIYVVAGGDGSDRAATGPARATRRSSVTGAPQGRHTAPRRRAVGTEQLQSVTSGGLAA